MYLAIKHLHLTTVYITITLFLLRGLAMMLRPQLLQRRWLRIVPHVNDTILLATGLTLTTFVQQYPVLNGWLTAKVIGLVIYIGLGMVALKRGRTKGVRIAAFIGALITFAYIYSVARAHHPLPWTVW
jgi:uncharacterized membrane protein SirB2